LGGASEYLDEEHGIRAVVVDLLREYREKNVVERLGRRYWGWKGLCIVFFAAAPPEAG